MSPRAYNGSGRPSWRRGDALAMKQTCLTTVPLLEEMLGASERFRG